MSSFNPKKSSKKASILKLILIFPVIILAVIGMVVLGGYYYYTSNLKAVSSDNTEVVVTIPVGTTVPAIADQLKEKSLIRSENVFEFYVRIEGYRGKLQAGGYKFSQSDSVAEIVDKLVSGTVADDLLTILPAQRLGQIEATFANAGYSPQEIKSALEPTQYKGHPALAYKDPKTNLEGYLYPESYSMTDSTELKTIVRSALDETAKRLTPELVSKFNSEGLNVRQAIILASIIEREVSKEEDRPKVAQVFLKRYQEGIMLGSDPTALYGALIAGIEPSVSADTPYNTRLYVGLPPGPINNISGDSLKALANPSNTDFLFFVSGDDGNTYFSNTLAEHEALTAQYCIELCKSY